MTGGFPVFQLPFVALKEVISQIDLVDIIKLSLVSKKSYCITKTLYQKSMKFRIGMSLSAFIAIEIKFDGSLFDQCVFEALELTEMPEEHDFIQIRNYRIPVAKTAEKSLHTYWTDPVEGLKMLTDYVTKFFNSKKVERLSVTDHHDSKKCNLSLNSDYFESCGAYWVTADVLLNINSRSTSIIGTKIDNQGYNRFLKHWQNGGSDRIEYFTLGSENVFEFDQVFEGIDVIVRDVNLQRRFEYSPGRAFTICGGWDIQ